MSPEQDALYNTLKANEANFPLPKPSTTIDVGTFDAQTGEFKYSIQTYSHQQPQIVPPDPTGHGPEKPVIVPRSPMTGGTISINTYTLILRFNVSGRQGDLMLDIGGYTFTHRRAKTMLNGIQGQHRRLLFCYLAVDTILLPNYLCE
jgi:hypothetical protein